jgi:5-methylcytosine-specific restriction enzyme subunit McrC
MNRDMTIPIQNIYYLLCYAWDCLDENETVPINSIESTSILELFAAVLVNGIIHLRKRGFDRGYIEYHEETKTLRGKINFDETLKRDLINQGRAFCSYDDLSYNVLHNQILKTTLKNLISFERLKKESRIKLFSAYRLLPEIETIHLSEKHFKQVILHRNNSFYRLILNICELIHRNLLVSEEMGETFFRDFIRDECQMRMLFQKFVRNFYHRELKDYKVLAEKIEWNAENLSKHSNGRLPTMNTDITLENKNRKIIIDTKFTDKLLMKRNYASAQAENDTFRTSHLYQIFTYLINVEKKDDLSATCDGMLLYPGINQDLHFEYRMGRHHLTIRTINLAQDWQNIHEDLLSIIKKISDR